MAINIPRSAFSLVLHKRGNPSHQDVTDLLNHYQNSKSVLVNRQEYDQAVELAKVRYHALENCLFICSNTTCSAKSSIDLSKPSIQNLSHKLGYPVETTGCHWSCDQAPVVTVKNGSQTQSFTNCSSPTQWNTLFETISKHKKQKPA